MVTMQKWLVDVRCEGWRGLFYRSAPNVIVPDADWPRNGDIVVGHEVPHVPGEHFADRPRLVDASSLDYLLLRALEER